MTKEQAKEISECKDCILARKKAKEIKDYFWAISVCGKHYDEVWDD